MKTIINKKTYNTETAKQIAYIDNRFCGNTFDYKSTTLYKTKKGNYFINYKGRHCFDYDNPICDKIEVIDNRKIEGLSIKEIEDYMRSITAHPYEKLTE